MLLAVEPGEFVEARTEALGPDAGEATTDSHRIARAVYQVTRRLDNTTLRLLDAGVIFVSWFLAYLAGFEGDIPRDLAGGPVLFLGLPLVTQLVANQLAGLYGPVWRFASVEEAARVLIAVGVGASLSTVELAVMTEITDTTLPVFTTPAVAALLILLGCGGMRFQARLFALERQRAGAKADGRVRTLIVGTGHAGASLAHELRIDARSELKLVGFVDDDPRMHGRSVRGLRVLGTIDDLERVCREHTIERVLVAMPEAGRDEIQEIVGRALKTDAQVKVLPHTTDMIGGPLLRSLRDLDLADLLGREHAPVDTAEIADYLEGATVLVTGAGGSIGSEIARQVTRFRPGRLLLLDRDESLLHEIASGELGDAEPVLADIRDQARIREVFERHRPDVVFHAAAHKHVPILEQYPAEAIQTNLIATWWLALAAAQYGCQRFVFISTDKAAEPCSVMGATKRAAELAVFEVGSQHRLPFAAVRFGNVLGSRGSVVPTFLRQILDGGPVTVTDPDMTRYFMTIPEAVSLVLQAAAMAKDGRVFLLDMGSPVSIVDLARQMIRLAGLRPGDDVAIEVTGARPGERLHEQLHDVDESIEPTAHPSISAVTPKAKPDPQTLLFFLGLLERKCTEVGAGPAAISLLEQLLRHCVVDCHLDASGGSDEDRTLLSETIEREISLISTATRSESASASSRPTSSKRSRARKLPALLGGDAEFPGGLPFARPTRPPLEQVEGRLRPSYERGVLTNGPLVDELEQRIAERIGVAHVVAVSSCTAGLMLTIQALTADRTGPVVLPSFTFSASAHAVAWNGRRPAFVECDPLTFQVDLDHAVEHLGDASALLATHVFGAPCMPALVTERARAAGVPVIFDAAHALGALHEGTPVGRFGDAEVFSLTPTKVLVAGEGGLVATNDAWLAEAIRLGRNYGDPGNYDTRFPGMNARMSEFHAAMALESFELLDDALRRRREIAALYREALAEIPGVRTQQISDCDASTYKDFTISIEPDAFGLTRDQLVAALRCDGIDTRSYFDPPVHRQQSYERLERTDLPVTDATAARVVSLPMFTDLTDEDVERVAAVVESACGHAEEIAASSRDVIDLRPRAAGLVEL